MTEESLWATTNRLLAEKSLACVQAPGEDTLSVVPLEKAATLARIEEEDPALARAGTIRVLRELRSDEPNAVVEALRAALPKEGGVALQLAASANVLLAGQKPQVLQALVLLDLLDAGPRETIVEEVPAKNVPAVTLATLIEQVSQKRKGIDREELKGSVVANAGAGTLVIVAPEGELSAWRAMIDRFDRKEAVTTRNYVPRRFGLGETARLLDEVVRADPTLGPSDDWRMVVDDLTGTLVVTATQGRHEATLALLERLESTEIPGRRELRSFAVEYREAEDLLAMLEALLEGGAGEMQAPERPAEAPAGAAEPAQGATGALPTSNPVVRPVAARSGSEEDLTLSVDSGTNRILAFGDVRLLAQVEELIGTLDVQHPQVMIETLAVSLSESQMRDLGVELAGQGTVGSAEWGLASLFGLGAPAPSDPALPSIEGSGFTGVILDQGSYAAVVRALEVLNEGRVLSAPRVLVANHEEATLDSVLQSPYLTTNATNTVATTSFGGTSDAGTSIQVSPHITDGDRLRLEYTVSISTFVGQPTDPALPPPRQENQLTSVVTLPDGYTVVIGGLDVETETKAVTQVPVLGWIPGIGELFKSRIVSRTKSRFFVFLRCSVLRGQGFEELRYLSGREMADAGIEDPWPRLEPRIIR